MAGEPTVEKFIEKWSDGVDQTKYESGVAEYVNDPNFETNFEKQKADAKTNYAVEAPASWAAKHALGLNLVSAASYKEAMTRPETGLAYAAGIAKGAAKLGKKAYITTKQAAAIMRVIAELPDATSKHKMLINYAVGQDFADAIYQELLGNGADSDTLIETIVKAFKSDGIAETYDETLTTPTALGTTLITVLKGARDEAVAGMQG